MKIQDRSKFKKIELIGMSSPQMRFEGEKKIPVMEGIDKRGNLVTYDCAKDVYLRIVGSNRANRPADGLDFRKNTTFVIYLNDKNVVVSLDIIPTIMYKGRTIPASQVGVDSMIIRYGQDNCVEVIQRPFNMRLPAMQEVIAAIDKLGGEVEVGTDVTPKARIVNIRDRDVEVDVMLQGEGERIY